MKKISVLLLAFALTLSMAAVASAAEFNPYLGGEFQVTYDGTKEKGGEPNKDGDVTSPIVGENGGTWARFKMMLTGTVEDEETGTWAKIGTKLSTWNTDEAAPIYEAGIKGIGGVLDIWYNGHEYENAKRGQIPLWTPMAKFGGDPLFDVAPGNVFAADYNSGNVTINFGYDLNKYKDNKDNKNLMIAAGTLNFDSGKAHFAFVDRSQTHTYDPDEAVKDDEIDYDYDENRMLVGGEYSLDFGTIYLDYFMISGDVKDDITGYEWEADGNVIQAAISLSDLGLKGTIVMDDGITFGEGGMGFGVEYTGIENVVLGARMMTADKKADEAKDFTDFYAGYNFGVFETRVGMYTTPNADYDDGVFYAAAHVGMW